MRTSVQVTDKAPGSMCGDDSECDPPTGYHRSSGVGPSTCVKYAEAGDPCMRPTDCDPRVPALYCDGVTLKCTQLPQTVGASCDDLCGGILYCPPSGKCAAPLEQRATCTIPGTTTPLPYRYDLQCDISKGLGCVGTGSSGTCARLDGSLGAACGSSTPVWKESCWQGYCTVFGTTDGSTGTCTAFASQGAACPKSSLPSCPPPTCASMELARRLPCAPPVRDVRQEAWERMRRRRTELGGVGSSEEASSRTKMRR